MVNAAVTSARAAERALAIGYAPVGRRAALEALFALDATLGTIARTAREPMVAQLRLTWWHGALEGLDHARPPAEPVLRALAAHVLPAGVSGAQLAGIVDGWEALLETPVGLDDFARGRGAELFAAAAALLRGQDGGNGTPVARAGEGWALADLAANGIGETRRRAAAAARERLAGVMALRWPRALRPLGALALLARFDVTAPSPPIAGPRRVARIAWHRVSGK